MTPSSRRVFRSFLGLLMLLVGGCVTATTETIVILDTDVPRDRPMTVSVSVAHAGGASSDASFEPSGAHGHVWVRAIGAATPADAGPARDASGLDVMSDARGFDASALDAQVRDAGNMMVGDAITLPASFAITPAPEDARDEDVQLTVVANVGPGVAGEPAIHLTRVVRFRFLPGHTSYLPVFLSIACAAPATGCLRTPTGQCTLDELCIEQGTTCGDHGVCVAIPAVPAVDAAAPQRDATDATDIPHVESCVPHCGGRVCGSNGCGGSCGTCSGGSSCDGTGHCSPPPCSGSCAGRNCGDDGCGYSCGDCTGPFVCGGDGVCGCPSGATACGGTCVNTATDGANCGSCGHACLVGQVCGSGTCCAATQGMISMVDGGWTASGQQWQYHDGWCSPMSPEGCYTGTYVYSFHLVGSACTAVGSAGTCQDPDAVYDVTCSATVRCQIDCAGNCNPTSC